MIKKNKIIILLILLLVSQVSYAEKEIWTPKLKFSVESSSYIETLFFISGLAYSLYQTDVELKKSDKKNFICIDSEQIDSKLIVDILNEKITGDVTADYLVSILFSELNKRFPC